MRPPKAGADRHPDWYLNLQADPEVAVQIGGQMFSATARTATSQEKPRLWRLVTTVPTYQADQDMTRRDIPVVIVERAVH